MTHTSHNEPSDLVTECALDPRWAARQIKDLAAMVAERDRLIGHPLVQACLAMNPHILADTELHHAD